MNWPGVNFDVEHFTVKVVRDPPSLQEIQNPARDVSIAPDLSARLQKRHSNVLFEPARAENDEYSMSRGAFGPVTNKRRRLEQIRTDDLDHPILSSERGLEITHDHDSSRVTNGSLYMVPDSQRSPRNERKLLSLPICSNPLISFPRAKLVWNSAISFRF